MLSAAVHWPGDIRCPKVKPGKLAVAIEAAAVELTIERGSATISVSLGPIEAGSAAWEKTGVPWAPRSQQGTCAGNAYQLARTRPSVPTT